jgi:two-component system, OmpR family, sensor histidine kinase MprB
MSLRRRLVLFSAAAVATAIVLAATATYVIVRAQLRGHLDNELRDFAGGVVIVKTQKKVERGSARTTTFGTATTAPAPLPRKGSPEEVRGAIKTDRLRLPKDALGGPAGYAQLISSSGRLVAPALAKGGIDLPITDRTRAVAAGKAAAYFSDANVNGVEARIYTRRVGNGVAMQAARSLEDVDHALARLRWILIAVCGAGIAAAAGLGVLVTRAGLRPVREMAGAAEHVAATHDLSRRIEAEGSDDLARWAKAFNTMLAELERSQRSQRQLVADASHELRSPLTTLRTNIEVLARSPAVRNSGDEQLLTDLTGQLGELSVLVGDLVDLARGVEEMPEPEDVRLDVLVEEIVERARKHAPTTRFELAAEPCIITGVPQRIERAVFNLLDNAAKWSPPGGPIEVRVAGGEVSVRDHGPGIGAADIPHVFDRFYRSPSARGLPGSGLGLAIVKQVAEMHGGGAVAEQAEGGGALLRLRLPRAAFLHNSDSRLQLV